MNRGQPILIVSLLILSLSGVLAGPKTTVVFVCEHGAARSVIAAAYFNELAAERHLKFQAIARGTTPQPDISPAASTGLEADGVSFEKGTPQPLKGADTAGAVRIVGLSPVPRAYARSVRVDEHDDVPEVSDNYAAARAAIVAYVRQLLDELQTETHQARRGRTATRIGSTAPRAR